MVWSGTEVLKRWLAYAAVFRIDCARTSLAKSRQALPGLRNEIGNNHEERFTHEQRPPYSPPDTLRFRPSDVLHVLGFTMQSQLLRVFDR